MNTRRSEDLIGMAYAELEDCPRPESFLEAELARLSSDERAKLDEHADRCPACGAERDLARVFDPSRAELEANRDELEPIVASLVSSAPLGASRPTGEVVRLDERRRPRVTRMRGLAAAAVIAVAAFGLWVVLRSPAPGLPSLGTEQAVRGMRIDVVRPVGDLAETPKSFEWKAVQDAHGYRVRLLAVDESVLWDSTVSAESADLPSELARQVHPAVVYVWQVEALDSAGTTLARSERVRFRVRPEARPDTR